MPERDELPSDPEAEEQWRRLPQNKPSRQAMPPAAGGARWVWWLVGALALVMIIAWLLQWV